MQLHNENGVELKIYYPMIKKSLPATVGEFNFIC